MIGTGSKPTHWNIPGADEHVLNLWSYDDAVKIKDHLEEMFIKASRTPDPVERKKILNMYIVGAGFTGVEMAGELAEARSDLSQDEIEEEFGDLLFVMANLARHMKVDPEAALRRTNAKFTRRFAGIEARLAKIGKRPEDSDLAEMDALWDAVKAAERAG